MIQENAGEQLKLNLLKFGKYSEWNRNNEVQNNPEIQSNEIQKRLDQLIKFFFTAIKLLY